VSGMPWYAVHPMISTQAATGGSVSPALDVAYPTTYYGGATEAEGASPIVIKGGERMQADITMEAVPALHIIFHTVANRYAGRCAAGRTQSRGAGRLRIDGGACGAVHGAAQQCG
jgi:hypothetical protein